METENVRQWLLRKEHIETILNNTYSISKAPNERIYIRGHGLEGGKIRVIYSSEGLQTGFNYVRKRHFIFTDEEVVQWLRDAGETIPNEYIVFIKPLGVAENGIMVTDREIGRRL